MSDKQKTKFLSKSRISTLGENIKCPKCGRVIQGSKGQRVCTRCGYANVAKRKYTYTSKDEEYWTKLKRSWGLL